MSILRKVTLTLAILVVAISLSESQQGDDFYQYNIKRIYQRNGRWIQKGWCGVKVGRNPPPIDDMIMNFDQPVKRLKPARGTVSKINDHSFLIKDIANENRYLSTAFRAYGVTEVELVLNCTSP